MTQTGNVILNTLTQQDLALLKPFLEAIDLKQGDLLFQQNEPITHAYFFQGGLSSEIAVSTSRDQIEIACVGREGFSAVPIVLGVRQSPHYAFMQVGGSALRIEADALQAAMEASPSLRRQLLKYAHVSMIQIASTALANGRYGVEQRLARWLLMCHDRLSDDLPLTHDFLALMLSVRRPSVTDALHKLEGQLAIRAERGLITIKNREKLEAIAGSAYGMPEAEYLRLIAEI